MNASEKEAIKFLRDEWWPESTDTLDHLRTAVLLLLSERASERRVAPEQPVMKCRSCEATTDKFAPYASCGRCGALLVDKVAPEQETAKCEKCGASGATYTYDGVIVCHKCGLLAIAPAAQDAVTEAMSAFYSARFDDSKMHGYDRMTAALRTFSARLRETAAGISLSDGSSGEMRRFERVLAQAERELLPEVKP